MAGGRGIHGSGTETLHDYARAGNVEAVQRLSTDAESVNARDRHSRTPLHLAAWAGQTEVVKVLCQNHADVGAAAADDMAAIHFASQKGHAEIVRLLLAAGAYVNSRTRKGMTPLHYAVQGGHTDLTTLLIKRGANLQSETKAGKKPIDLTRDEAFQSFVKTAECERLAQRNTKSSGKSKAGGKEVTVAQSAQLDGKELGKAEGASSIDRGDNDDTEIVKPPEKEGHISELQGTGTEDTEGTKKNEAESEEEVKDEWIGPKKKKVKVSLSHLFTDETEEDA